MDAEADEVVEPGIVEELVDVRLAEARRHAGEEPGFEADLEATERAVEHLPIASADVAGGGVPLDAQKRRGIADPGEPAGDVGGDQLAVGEDLEVAVAMPLEEIEEPRMEERLATEKAEERVPVRFRVGDDPVELLRRHHRPRRLDVDPASLAAEVAGIDDREVEERREDDPTALAGLESLHGEHAFEAEVPAGLPQALRRHGGDDAGRELRKHGGPSVVGVVGGD